MFPVGYLKYDGIENLRGADGEWYIHCKKNEGCELEMVRDFSTLGAGAVQIEYFSPVFGSFIDFKIDDVKVLLEYYITDDNDFIYDIRVFDSDGSLVGKYEDLNVMTRTKLKIEWYKNNLKIYVFNDYIWGKILDLKVHFGVGKWKMNIKGVIEIYNIAVYRRWI